MSPFDFLEYVSNILPRPYNIIVITCVLSLILIIKYPDNSERESIKQYIKQYLYKNPRKSFIAIVIMSLTLTSCVSYYLNENYIFPKPSQDKFLVSISPFYLDNSQVDSDTAKEVKEKIENSTDNRIKAIVLDEPTIRDDKEAVFRGKKAGSNLVIYGGEKRKIGDIKEIEFHIIPTNLEISTSKPEILNNSDNTKFKSTFCPTTNNSIIVESLTDNVSSTVYALCALDYYNRFEYNSAINAFKSVKNYETEGVILYYVANCYFYESKFNESLLYYNKTIKTNPQISEAWNNKVCILAYLGDYDEVMAVCDKALKVNPKDSQAWYNKGICFLYLNNYEEALKAFNKATEINPLYLEAWNNKGVSFELLGKYEEAIKAFDEAIKINPQSLKAWNNKGTTLEYSSNYREAVIAFDKAIEINPQDSKVWCNRGDALNSLGNDEEAIRSYDEAIKINPQDSDIWVRKGNAFSNSSNYEEAIKAYDEAIKINPQDSITWYNKGTNLGYLGNFEEAVKAYDKAIEINPRFLEAWYDKGLALGELKRYEKALEAFNKAIEINPQYSKAWYYKGAALRELGNYPEAVKAFNRSLGINNQSNIKIEIGTDNILN